MSPGAAVEEKGSGTEGPEPRPSRRIDRNAFRGVVVGRSKGCPLSIFEDIHPGAVRCPGTALRVEGEGVEEAAFAKALSLLEHGPRIIGERGDAVRCKDPDCAIRRDPYVVHKLVGSSARR